MVGKPDIHKGDRVIIDQCPKYSIDGSHKATILGEPVRLDGGEWIAPIRFNCITRSHANYPTNKMIKIRSKIVKLSRPAIVTAIILTFVSILFLWGAGNYNDLVRAKNSVSNSRAKIDTELTRRYDLIDNVVASVKGSQAQESEVFGKIAEARKIGGNSQDPEQQAQANNAIDQQIALLPRLQEAYPELRSNEQITRLIQELQGTNNTIRDKRNDYNSTVTNYNNNVTAFPKNIFANIFNFDKEKLFEAKNEERNNVKVDFSKNGQ